MKIRLLIAIATLFFASFCAAQPVGVSLGIIKTSESKGALEATVVEGGSWFRIRSLGHYVVVIKHPQGTVLFDTGVGKVTAQAFAKNSWLNRILFGFQPGRPAVEQLREHGIEPKNIHAILISHLHWDHSGGIPDFPGVPVWVQKEEYDAAINGHLPAYFPEQQPTDARWHFYTLEDKPWEGFPRSLDIFGDGSLVLAGLPGHTPGHTGLFVRAANGKHYFFIGDTTWTREGIQQQKPRPRITQWLTGVDWDREKNTAWIEKIVALSRQYPDLVIVPAHDENVAKDLPVFPAFTSE